MKKLLTGISAFVALAASAERALVPSPTVLDFTRGDGWGLALGASVEFESAYDGSDERELEFEPAGAVQYRSGKHLLFWEGFELGWRGRVHDRTLLQAGVRYEDGLEPDDSEDNRLEGMPARDSHVVGFLEGRQALDDAWRNWVGGRVMGGDTGFGWLGVLAAGHRVGEQADGTGTEVFAFATFGTADFLNKDFGVSAADAAASGLEETKLDGGYRSAGITLVHRSALTRNLHLVLQAGAERYGGDIPDSPIAREDFEIEAGASLLWHF